jgi:hypothetical protein
MALPQPWMLAEDHMSLRKHFAWDSKSAGRREKNEKKCEQSPLLRKPAWKVIGTTDAGKTAAMPLVQASHLNIGRNGHHELH